LFRKIVFEQIELKKENGCRTKARRTSSQRRPKKMIDDRDSLGHCLHENNPAINGWAIIKETVCEKIAERQLRFSLDENSYPQHCPNI
jgi:hypothetical protein